MKKAILKKAACSAFIFAMVASTAVAAPKAKADKTKSKENTKIERPANPGKPENCPPPMGFCPAKVEFDENNLPKADGDIYAENGMLKIKATDGKTYLLCPDFDKDAPQMKHPTKDLQDGDFKPGERRPGENGHLPPDAKGPKGKMKKGAPAEKPVVTEEAQAE